jgi:hypothetical protein
MNQLYWIQLKAFWKNTFLLEWRSRNIIIFSVLMILILVIMGSISIETLQFFQIPLSAEQFAKNKWQFYQNILVGFSWFLGLFQGLNYLRQDYDDKVVGLFFTFPLSRLFYLCARLSGLYLFLMAFQLVFWFIGGIFFSISAQQWLFQSGFLIRLLLSSFSFLVTFTLAGIFSLLFQRTAALIFSFSSIVILNRIAAFSHHFSWDYLPSHYFPSQTIYIVMKTLWWIVPHATYFEFVGEEWTKPLQVTETINPANEELLKGSMFFLQGTHFLFSYGLMFFLLFLVIKKKDADI